MKGIYLLLALYWAGMFLAFVTGNYTPTNFDIGAALVLTSLSFVSSALEAK